MVGGGENFGFSKRKGKRKFPVAVVLTTECICFLYLLIVL